PAARSLGLAGAAVAAARSRARLLRRLSQCAEPVSRAARRTRPAAGAGLSRASAVSRGAEPLPLPLFRSAAARGRARGNGAVAGDRRGPARSLAGACDDCALAGGLGALSLDRQRGADILFLWLGIAAARSRFSRRFSRAG